jgi:small subunit ribosomal protein S3
LGYTTDWKSRWFNRKKYKDYLKQDYYLRQFLMARLKQAAVNEIEIKRAANSINIMVRAARPGIIIGRGGAGIQEIKKEIISKIFKGQTKGLDIKIDIEEVKKPETHARVVAQNIADQLERRMPFRRVMKQTMDKVMQNPEVKGAKIWISGRLGGAEMAREEWLKVGEVPLQTLRADIDYAQVNAYTTYGTIGVKVWIYKGEKFE